MCLTGMSRSNMATELEIKLANQNAALLQKLAALLSEYAKLCDQVCKKPERNAVYRQIKAELITP